jgi:hypothetical protein
MHQPDPIWIFLDPLESEGFEYFVTGSVASIFYGEPRLTHDIDLVLQLQVANLQKFTELYSPDYYYCPPQEILQIEMKRRPYGHFNLIHYASGFKADFYLNGNDPLHSWAMLHRKRISFSPTKQLWLAPPEYVIIRKLEFFREGGSDKHLQDIHNMIPQIEESLDQKFLVQKLEEKGLLEFWLKLTKG